MSSGWTRHGERGSPVMLYLIRWIALHLGRKPARLILYPITLYFLLFAPAARRASFDYLSRALERPVHWWHVARHIFTFSATILDRVYLLTGRHALLDVQIHGLAAVQKRLDAGSGLDQVQLRLHQFLSVGWHRLFGVQQPAADADKSHCS